MLSPRSATTLLLAAAAAAVPIFAAPRGGDPEPVDFNRDVRPILSENCFVCHGPDPGTRKAKLRLDTFDGATAAARGSAAVVPGDREESELWYRVSTGDFDDHMPPAESGKSLTPEQVEVLGRWIDQGARYDLHWSLVPPVTGELPAVEHEQWLRSPADRFVLQRLEQEGLAPSPAADRATLLRRVSLDLTGLPPSLDELDDFLADPSPDAYERAVDRLLDSPRYGEHLARHWLDAARYGDTHGLHLDNQRTMWPYRDWVIRAFNDNKPFDDFVVEQLAGDLLPEPTTDDLVATGFNRCNPTSAEGGMIAEEFLAKYAMDRVDTTSTVFLGLTMGCAQCHDHKFDPLQQRDYYRMFAFFNNFDEKASDENIMAPPPVLKVPSRQQESELGRLGAELAGQRAAMEAPMPASDAAQAEWELEQRWAIADRWSPFRPDGLASVNGTALDLGPGGAIDAGGPSPDIEVYELRGRAPMERIRALRLEVLLPPDVVGVGRWPDNGNVVMSGFEVAAAPAGTEDFQPVALVHAVADFSQDLWPITAALDGRADTGWALLPRTGEEHQAVFAPASPFGFAGGTELRVRLRFESVHKQHTLRRFRVSVSDDPSLAPVTLEPWQKSGPYPADSAEDAHQRDFGPEGDRSGVTWEPLDAADGEPHQLPGEVSATYLARVIRAPSARQVELALGSDDSFKLWLNGELHTDRFVARALAADQDRVRLDLRAGANRVLLKIANHGGAAGFSFRVPRQELGELPREVALALRAAGEARSPAQRTTLRDHFRRRHSPEWAALQDQTVALAESLAALQAAVPTTLVVRERVERRPARLLERGQYDAPGEELSAGIPAVFGSLGSGDRGASRLELARWLVDGSHPLTARVAVNRLWQRFFGAGIVKTSEDFGSQGEWPSHPALLDWLAVELVDSGWDLKHVQRLIVTSATYRQRSRAAPELLERDPENRLLARGPRHRLDAEQIRDLALFASGLLVEKQGGPSVKPYQPDGLWKAVGYSGSNTVRFERDSGEALYRRSLYTFWKRTAPPPTMGLFDAPTRESCSVRRARTNTPLQALALMNDVQFVEAARMLGLRARREAGPEPDAVAARAFRLATSRQPDDFERAVLLEQFRGQLAAFQRDPAAAAALLAVGEAPRPPGTGGIDDAELAAWAAVSSLILNLDETVTKS
ncbi:MAG: PSD1 domain-containing protein [Planctomycetes bacterium]|nr:PSD1 domain-containing protein [Planctomycetota bacterium]